MDVKIIKREYISILLVEEVIKKFTGSKIKNIIYEDYNIDYEGFTFDLEARSYRSRLAKLTPKKKGYFVVFWEKDEDLKNIAYTYENSTEKIIVSIIDGNKKGQFVFDKEILKNKGILKYENNKGKMAIRVYPPWEENLNMNAFKTQTWQKDYFIDLSEGVNLEKLEELYL